MPKTFTFSFALAIFLFFPSRSVAEEFSAPLKKQGFGFFVEATLNKKVKADLLIDTGSAFVVISGELAKQLELGDLKKMPRYPVSTVAGVKWTRLTVLDSVSVGGAVSHSVEVAVIEKPADGVPGFLGANFLKDFVHTVDGPASKFSLKSAHTGKTYGGHDENWWRKRSEKYSKAVKTYENWLDMLQSGFHRTKTDAGYELSERQVVALIGHYKKLLRGLKLRAQTFAVPAAWMAAP